MSFTIIRNFILRNKKSLFFSIFLIFALFPELSFADATTQESTGEDKDIIIEVLNSIIKIGGMVIGLLTQLVGLFLTPEWSSGSAIGFGGQLKKMWILVSNVVYTVFALILIIIAFMNIIGKGENTWELKQAIPKFIVGILIVPFSWFIVSAFIGLSNILTVSILSLPYTTFENSMVSAGSDKKILCSTYEYGKKSDDGNKTLPIQCKDGLPPDKSIDDLMKENKGLFGIMSIYTYQIMKIQANGALFSEDISKGDISNWTELVEKGIFDIIFFIAFLILLISIGMALFVRGIYLWVFTVLSPAFGLIYFFGSDKVGDLGKFSFSSFLSLVMVPVYVAAALSFGLVFISVASKGMSEEECKPSSNNNGCIAFTEEGNVSTVEFLGIKIEYHGSIKDSAKSKVGEAFGALKGSFGTLVLQIFGLVILWMALMAALERSEITKAIVEPIKTFGNSIGEIAMKSPSYAPIFPSPSGTPMSAQSLGTFGNQIKSNLNSKFSEKGIEESKRFGGDSTSSKIRGEMVKINGKDTNIDAPIFKSQIGYEIKNQTDLNALKASLVKMGVEEKSLETLNMTIVKDSKKFAEFLSSNKDKKLIDLLTKSKITRNKQMIQDHLESQGKNSSSSGSPSPTTNTFVITTKDNDVSLKSLTGDKTKDDKKLGDIANNINESFDSNNRQSFIEALASEIMKLNKKITDKDYATKLAEAVANIKNPPPTS